MVFTPIADSFGKGFSCAYCRPWPVAHPYPDLLSSALCTNPQDAIGGAC